MARKVHFAKLAGGEPDCGAREGQPRKTFRTSPNREEVTCRCCQDRLAFRERAEAMEGQGMTEHRNNAMSATERANRRWDNALHGPCQPRQSTFDPTLVQDYYCRMIVAQSRFLAAWWCWCWGVNRDR